MKFYSKLIWGLLTVTLAAAAFDAQAKQIGRAHV